MSSVVHSKHGIPIRLTDERWAHIIEEHGELSGLRENVLQTITDPERIVSGKVDELLAYQKLAEGKWLVVVYREFRDDGFIITSFMTRRLRALIRRKQVWP